MNCPRCDAPVPVGSGFCINCGEKMPDDNLCPHCKAPVPKDSDFCINCGSKMPKKEKTCPQCGELLIEGRAFCFNCGAQISIRAPKQPTAWFPCPRCRTANPETSNFCLACGTPLEKVIVKKYATDSKLPQKSNCFCRKGVASLILAVIGTILCFLYGPLAGFVGCTAAGLGIRGILEANRYGERGKGFAIAGLISGIFVVPLSVVSLAFLIYIGAEDYSMGAFEALLLFLDRIL